MSRTFLRTPSRGLGGGIERYVETLESAFAVQGVESASTSAGRVPPPMRGCSLGAGE